MVEEVFFLVKFCLKTFPFSVMNRIVQLTWMLAVIKSMIGCLLLKKFEEPIVIHSQGKNP
jgi:hypothetical protein